MKRKTFLKTLLLLPAAFALPAQAALIPVTVYKTKTCGCCGNWVQLMKTSGFDIKVEEVDSTADARRKFGVPEALASCHTAVVNGYAIEGHVPPADIHRLLKDHPKAAGLAVPGMVMGSPGMEGNRSDAYSVMIFDASGKSSVYQSYPAK
jgi:hypothetical protein